MNMRMKKLSVRSFPAMAIVLAWSVPMASGAAEPYVLTKNTASSASASLIPRCGPGAFENPDGVPRTPGDPDGVPRTPGDPDRKGKKLFELSRKSLTTPGQPDLGIAYVNATQVGADYTLQFCVVNRGGKPAFAPIAVAVRADDATLQELTIFQTIPSRRAICFGSGNPEQVPGGVKLAGATILVTMAAGEIALVDNQCRIDWQK